MGNTISPEESIARHSLYVNPDNVHSVPLPPLLPEACYQHMPCNPAKVPVSCSPSLSLHGHVTLASLGHLGSARCQHEMDAND
jgi:hypothetical protein